MALIIRPGVTIGSGMTVKVPVYVPPPKSLSWDGTDHLFVKITGNTVDWNLSNPSSGPGYWTII